MVGAASVLGGVSRMTVPQFPADIGKEGVFQLRLVRGPSLWWSSCWNLLEAFFMAAWQFFSNLLMKDIGFLDG